MILKFMRQFFFYAKIGNIYRMYILGGDMIMEKDILIDSLQGQQDIQFIHDCFSKIGLSWEQCQLTKEELTQCCDHRDEQGHLLLEKEDPYDGFAVCPKCKTMIVMDFDDSQEIYNLKDIFKVDLVSHIDKAWHILNKLVLKSEKDLNFYKHNLNVLFEMVQRESLNYLIIMTKLQHCVLNLPHYDAFTSQHIRRIIFPVLKQMEFMETWVYELFVQISNQVQGLESESTEALLQNVADLNTPDELSFIYRCFQKTGTTLNDNLLSEVQGEKCCNHRDAQGHLLLQCSHTKGMVECRRCHDVFSLDFNELTGQYVSRSLFDNPGLGGYDLFQENTLENAERVLKELSAVRTDSFQKCRDVLGELERQQNLVKKERDACCEILDRLDLCILEIPYLNEFTVRQIQHAVYPAKKAIDSRLLWAVELKKRIDSLLQRLKQKKDLELRVS